MNRFLSLLALLLLLPTPILAASWFRTIRVEWQYTPPIEPAVDGFSLYTGGKQVCRFDGKDTRAGVCTVLIAAPTTQFTMTATFADGTESPHSPPFEFSDTVPAPVLIKITR